MHRALRLIPPAASTLVGLLNTCYCTPDDTRPLAEQTVREALSSNPKAIATLAVAALNLATVTTGGGQKPITMYGATITADGTTLKGLADTLGKPAAARRTTYEAHPYRKPGAGVNCFVLSTNSLGEPAIILGSKKKEPGVLIVPGGYLQNFPALGYQGAEQSDIQEKALLIGESTIDNKTPTVAKLRYDRNFEENFRRELEEETHLTLPRTTTISILRTSFTYDPVTQPLHTIEANMYTHIDGLPHLSPGDDLDTAEWIAIRDISVGSDGKYYYAGNVIKDKYRPDIDAAISTYYNQALEKITSGKFKDLAQLANFDGTLKALLAKKPTSLAGEKSINWHEQFLAIVQLKMSNNREPIWTALRGQSLTFQSHYPPSCAATTTSPELR